MKHEIKLHLLTVVLGVMMCMYSLTNTLHAGDMQYRFKSPSFTGIGTSAHYLTIENQEFTRKAEIKKKQIAEEERMLSEAKNTNYAKFMDNLESRMYAELSKHLSEAVFGESCGQTYTTNSTTGQVTVDTMNPRDGNDDGVGTSCSGTYTFNDTTFTYNKDITNDVITLDIAGPDGNSTIELPLNDFKF